MIQKLVLDEEKHIYETKLNEIVIRREEKEKAPQRKRAISRKI